MYTLQGVENCFVITKPSGRSNIRVICQEVFQKKYNKINSSKKRSAGNIRFQKKKRKRISIYKDNNSQGVGGFCVRIH